MSRVRVLIVDDSPFIRKALLRIFESDPSIVVVGVARNGREAVGKVEYLNPDVITLDIMMPELDGLETLKILMETHPAPVLMLSQFTKEGAELTLKALELGAMDFVDKSSVGLMDFCNLSKEIISKVRAIAGNKPYKAPLNGKNLIGESLSYKKGSGLVDVVAVGASTGGPPALQMLLQRLPAEIGFGLLIVQHMPHGFTGPLAQRLDSLCRIKVKEAEEGDRIEPALAVIAPSGLHMTASRTGVKLDVEPLNTVHRPSVDVLFNSVAETFGERSIGVILTGMGSDGAKGLLRIKENGGFTIAQDEATSSIFGMPKVAIEGGAAQRILPITDIAEELMRRA